MEPKVTQVQRAKNTLNEMRDLLQSYEGNTECSYLIRIGINECIKVFIARYNTLLNKEF